MKSLGFYIYIYLLSVSLNIYAVPITEFSVKLTNTEEINLQHPWDKRKPSV